MKTELPELNSKNELAIRDAISLLKSDFTTLYSKIGYDKNKASIAWHTLRVSPKGVEMRLKVRGTSIISDFDTEAKERKEQLLNLKPVEMKEKEAEPTAEAQGEGGAMPSAEEVATKGAKPKKEKKVKEPKAPKEKKEGGRVRGTLKNSIMDLINAGETDFKVLMEKTGASKHFTKWLLKQTKKTDTVVE